MKLEDQVCSLELAKQLKELGVKQESFAVWANVDKEWIICLEEFLPMGKDSFAAFTVAELGEMLPKGCSSGQLDDSDDDCRYWCLYNAPEDEMENSMHAEVTEADARASMLIHLIKKGVVKP